MNNSGNPYKARNVDGVINTTLLYLRTSKTSARAVVLVEGPDDVKIYQTFLDQKAARIVSCKGKDNVQKALSELLDKTNHVAGIRDADFCNLEHINPENPNLFFTDRHDIEMTMLHFEEIRRSLFSEYGDADKMDSIWEAILKKASYVGYIRWFNEKNDYKIFFKGFFNMCDTDDEQIALDTLNDRSYEKRESLRKEMIDDFISTYKTDDMFNLCNGHDVSDLLARTLKVNAEPLAAAIRSSFQSGQFIKTDLYTKLCAWQKDHGITILYSFYEKEACND